MGYATAGRVGQIIALVTAIVFSIPGGRATAGPFANLDFEDSPIPGNATMSFSEPTAILFPSWTVRFGDYVATTGSLNVGLLAGATDILYTSDTPSTGILQGTRTLGITGWMGPTSIAQIGDVPADARSIRFLAVAGYITAPGSPFLTMNGHDVPLITLLQSGNIVTFGGDITAWAGTNSELRIAVTGLTPNVGPSSSLIDAIEFSPIPLPEPASVLVLSCAGIFLFSRRQTR